MNSVSLLFENAMQKHYHVCILEIRLLAANLICCSPFVLKTFKHFFRVCVCVYFQTRYISLPFSLCPPFHAKYFTRFDDKLLFGLPFYLFVVLIQICRMSRISCVCIFVYNIYICMCMCMCCHGLLSWILWIVHNLFVCDQCGIWYRFNKSISMFYSNIMMIARHDVKHMAVDVFGKTPMCAKRHSLLKPRWMSFCMIHTPKLQTIL